MVPGAGILCLLLACLPVLPVPAQEQKPAATLAELQQRLKEHVSQPKYDAALWGVKVVSLDSGKTLFEQNPNKLFSPASNCKLYTVAMALDRLGADYRIKTSLYAKARPNKSGKLGGDLIVYGRGDPTINARLHGGDIRGFTGRPFGARRRYLPGARTAGGRPAQRGRQTHRRRPGGR